MRSAGDVESESISEGAASYAGSAIVATEVGEGIESDREMNEQLIQVFRGMTLVGKAAFAFATLALVVGLWSSAGVLGALLRPALDAFSVPAADPALTEKFASALDANRDFIGRKSIFFTPQAPVTTPTEGADPVQERRSTYGGPKLMGLSGHFAYFDRAVLNGAQEIKIGETGGTVELMRIVPPFKAVVKWQTQEWTLDLLKTEAIYTAGSRQSGSISDRFGVSNRGGTNPFTRRGSSPNGNRLFGEASTQSGATGTSGAVPLGRPTRGGPTEN